MGANGHPPPASAAVQNGSHSGGGGGGANPSNGGTAAALRHDPGLAREWSPEEQATLDELLAKYASDAPVIRYAKIAMKLPEKTVRDVALRCRWMNKKESGKRKKEDHNSSRKSKDKKIQDNIALFCQTRDNILRVLKEINDAPELMKQMPALPVKINEELVNTMLPRPTVPMQ
nr:unnamed protein product [Digitaria exilis]